MQKLQFHEKNKRTIDSLSFVKKESNSFPRKGPKKILFRGEAEEKNFLGPFQGKEFDSFLYK